MISMLTQKHRAKTAKIATFVFALIAVITVVVGGGGNGQAETAPEKGKVFGDWIVDCETPKDKPQICFLSQEQTQKEGGGRVLKFSLGKLGPKGEVMVVAILPLGISLPAGAALRIDAKDQKPMILQQCTGEGCVATMVLDKATVDALKAAKEMLVGILPFGGTQTMVINVSVKGLTGGMTYMKY
ncbi:hypothetical protein WCLP8_2150003 [uncultured Gammaproteobacteria bacterium]